MWRAIKFARLPHLCFGCYSFGHCDPTNSGVIPQGHKQQGRALVHQTLPRICRVWKPAVGTQELSTAHIYRKFTSPFLVAQFQPKVNYKYIIKVMILQMSFFFHCFSEGCLFTLLLFTSVFSNGPLWKLWHLFTSFHFLYFHEKDSGWTEGSSKFS